MHMVGVDYALKVFESFSPICKLLSIDFIIQVNGFIISLIFKSEKIYDLFGSATFLLLAYLNFKWHNVGHPRQMIQTACISIWAFRLGLFLFTRILKRGKDRRFDVIKKNTNMFFGAWIMQGVWVFVNVLPSFICLSNEQRPIGWRDYVGWGLWTFGFLIETVADVQKTIFRNNPVNKDNFIRTGLWAYSRHPNYFGEIVLWFGLYLSASSVFTSYEYLTVLCPIFNYVLITRLSGTPPLEQYGMKKWGNLYQYKDYLRSTPSLVPFCF